MAHSILLFMLVLNESIRFLVDSIVCQVNAEVVQIISHRTTVLVSRIPYKALIVNESVITTRAY